MIRVSVLYPQTAGAPFEWGYYLNSHLPLVSQKLAPSLKSVSIEKGLSGGSPGSPPAFVALVHLDFDSVGAFETAFAPHAAEIMDDIPNYTTIEPIIQISEVK